MTEKETDILAKCRLMLSALGAIGWRNNVGALKDKKGRPVRYGLCKGSSDWIGFYPVKITQDMVGKVIAVFTAIECKADKGIVSPEQKNFLDVIRKHGGISGIARSDNDCDKILKDGAHTLSRTEN